MDLSVSPESIATSRTDEARLVARAIDRDAGAFAQLYDAYLDRIFRYVYYRVGSTAEAEDVTERVFLKAWKAIDRYEARGAPFTAWLYRLAHHLVIAHDRGRRATTSLDDLDEGALPGGDAGGEVGGSLAAEDVRAALRRLHPEQQHLLVLRFVEGYSHAEVARLIGKSEGAARVIQFRALQALERVLDARGVSSSDARRRSAG